MKVHFRNYNRKDFRRVRDFLVDSFPRFARPRNWLIDRWNFVSEVGRIMNRLSESQWADGIGLWEDSGRIAAIANEEEGKGDVFLQFASPGVMTEPLVREMLSFADSHCIRPRKGDPGYMLRVPDGDDLPARLAAEQGLVKTFSPTAGWRSIDSDPPPITGKSLTWPCWVPRETWFHSPRSGWT